MEAGFKVIVACESKLMKERIEEKLRRVGVREKSIVIKASELLKKPLSQFITSSHSLPNFQFFAKRDQHEES